ncbi:PREDICTED: AT-hook motif nuclear-localized protein 17-like [Ipomoea nil]|uniref:AT-hook motif nuclear-localized protein 17-like n=1 Tax=Ipomoea nil TaxID=35883 RepID=UPI000900AB50|nr:PREDICTED: AT-hook motif nuclear-localized protein 17-like [Ipomoea nil]
MKPEYIQGKKGMFAKLDQSSHKFQSHHYHLRQLQPENAFQDAAGGLELKSSEEGDNCKNSEVVVAPQPISAVGGTPSCVNDGASIEISRRPRGRPPGSKNKPKPPVVITLDAGPSMSPYVLELPGGVDLIGSVTRFCRKRDMGLCVLSGSGTVSDVTLRQPSTAPGPNIIFHGRFDILSISATILNPNVNFSGVTSRPEDFTIALAGPQGQVVGGPVVGPLTTAGPVYLIAATFNNPLHHRLPVDEEGKNCGGGNESGLQSSGGEESGGATEPRGLSSTFNCQMASDVIWAPTARQAPPPY